MEPTDSGISLPARARQVVEPEYPNFDASVMRDVDDQGTHFGKCAETYPFLYLFRYASIVICLSLPFR